ncbi:MAG: hypothetical protein WAN65_16315, partial [Candidatus Sulfotelmatobacter sp.]
MRSISVAILLSTLAAPALAQGQDAGLAPSSRALPQSAAQMQLSFAPVVAKVAPSVVNVYSR